MASVKNLIQMEFTLTKWNLLLQLTGIKKDRNKERPNKERPNKERRIKKGVKAMKERRSSIELMRFLAAILIVFWHICERFSLDIGPAEYALISVDFFFMIAGFFIMRDAAADDGGGMPAAYDSIKYTWHKAKGIYSLYFFALVLMFVIRTALKDSFSIVETLKELFHFKWEFMMLHLAGFNHDPKFNADFLLGPGWFISTLMIATVPAYFLGKRFGKNYSGVIAPLCATAIYCYILQNYNSMNVGIQFVPGTMLANLRGFADVSVGAFVYHVNGWVRQLSENGKSRIFLRRMDVVSWGMVLAFFVLPDQVIPMADMLFWMFPFAVLLLNSINDIGPVSHWLNHHGTSLWNRMGRLSLYIYLLHFQIISIWQKIEPPVPPVSAYLLITALVLLFSLLVMMVRERAYFFTDKAKFI